MTLKKTTVKSEIKDNSIQMKAFLNTSTDKVLKEAPIKQLQVRISADELDGKREEFDHLLHQNVILTITPLQTELDVDVPKEDANPNQTELIEDK